ncbi:MAG: KH domain-containing protein [Asgard group archaeon]|nr:KH domain-containing protein [Asgard group archaeon]
MPNMSDMLNDFVQDTTQKIVDKPEDVEVKATVSTKAVIIQVRVHDRDCGKIIGRRGRTIDALKVLCLAIKNTQFPNDSRRVMLEVLEDENTQFNYNNQ